jgi:hypothetical protein
MKTSFFLPICVFFAGSSVALLAAPSPTATATPSPSGGASPASSASPMSSMRPERVGGKLHSVREMIERRGTRVQQRPAGMAASPSASGSPRRLPWPARRKIERPALSPPPGSEREKEIQNRERLQKQRKSQAQIFHPRRIVPLNVSPSPANQHKSDKGEAGEKKGSAKSTTSGSGSATPSPSPGR